MIIPAYNQEQHLGACLDAVLRDRPTNVQVLVVDDASSDRTVEIAASRGVKVVRRPTNGGPAAARNLGARHAVGDILIFVDADVVLAPGVIGRIIRTFADDPALAALFGSYDASPHARSVVSEYRNLLHHFTHQQASVDATTFWSGCGAIRADALHAIGGFDERPAINYIEDVELGWRLRRMGYPIRLDKGLKATHRKRWTFSDMVRTDVLFRARPWSQLILEGHALGDDLSLRWSQRLAVPLTALGVVLVACGAFTAYALALGVLAMLAALALNAPLFRFLAAARGPGFALACAPLHLVHYLSSVAGVAIALYQSWPAARLLVSRSTTDRATP